MDTGLDCCITFASAIAAAAGARDPLPNFLIPALAMLVCLLTASYVAVRLWLRLPRRPSLFLNLVTITWDPTRQVEGLCALILLQRGIYGLSHLPQTARRLEEAWILVAYIAIAGAHGAALATDHRFGRSICATLQCVIWVTISAQIWRLDHELTNSFPALALSMLWAALRLRVLEDYERR